MDDTVAFGSGHYRVLLLVLLFARGMDFLSTWVATPRMVLEGNPIAKKLGWRWGIPVNIALCLGFACWPLPAIVIGTTSLLVAARNFQSAWLMRTMGEVGYRDWYVDRVRETPVTLYLWCLAGNTLLTAAVGVVLVVFTILYATRMAVVPFGIGLGMLAYAVAVALFTLLAVWRMRRAELRHERSLKEWSRSRGDVVEVICQQGGQPESK